MHPQTRRYFLKTTIAGSAALTPYIFTTRCSAAEEKNDKLNLAAIGVGGRGSNLGHKAGKLGNMVACADVHLDHAEKFCQEYNGSCQLYRDYRHVLDRKDVDAIICGTPDHWHVKIAIDAMRSGKDVYCEKPLTLTIAESKQIADATKETGRVLQVGTQQRSEYAQRFLKAIAIAQSGRLGNVLHATCSIGGSAKGGPFSREPIPNHLDWDMWLGQAPYVSYCCQRAIYDFRWWLEYSGGRITDWGAHHTDIALWALGGMESTKLEVEGNGVFPGIPYTVNMVDFLNGRTRLSNQFNTAIRFDITFHLDNGNTMVINDNENQILIEGDQGQIRVDRGSLTGKPVEEIAKSDPDQEWLAQQVKELSRNLPLDDHMLNFFHCVKTRQNPISDVWSHTRSVNVCHMANIAMLLKRKLIFDYERYDFGSDEEANLFISRRQRDPWRTDA